MTTLVLTTTLSETLNLIDENGMIVPCIPQPGGGSAVAASPTFVFRPGGVAGGNVYTTWPTLMAAVQAVQGPKWIQVDTSIAAAHATAGNWNLEQCTLLGEGGTLIVDTGSVWTWTMLTIGPLLTVSSAAAAPVCTLTSSAAILYLLESAQLKTTGGEGSGFAFVDVKTGATFITFQFGQSLLGDGTGVVIHAENGSTLTSAVFDNAQLTANSVANDVGSTFNLTANADAVINASYTPTYVAKAPQVLFTPTTAGNWTTPPTTVQGALDQLALGGAPAAAGHTLVFRPGGTAGGNVYTTWASLMAAASTLPGPKTISVDTSLGAAHVTAGAWNVDQFTFTGEGGTLTIDDGATLTFTVLTIGPLATLAYVGTGPCATITGGNVIYFQGGGTLTASAAGPFAQVNNGALLLFYQFSTSTVGDGTHAVVHVLNGGSFTNTAFQFSTFSAAAVTTDAGGTTNLSGDDTTVYNMGTPLKLSKAAQDSYTAAVVADWSGTNPSSVANALDRIAAKITPIP